MRKMDIKYQHPSIQLYILNPKASTTTEASVPKDDEESSCVLNTESFKEDDVFDDSNLEKLNDWETRRYGSMAARLLEDVKIS